MTSIYRAIFRQSLQIMWKFKWLWFFGIFAALISNAGEVNLMLDNFPQVSESASSLEILRAVYQEGIIGNFGANFQQMITSLGWSGWALVLILLVLALFILWLAITSQAGLMLGAYKIFKKQSTSFVDAFKTGRQKFWPVLWLNIVGRLITYAAWLVVGLPLIALYLTQGTNLGRVLFVVLSFVILLPLAIIISFLIKYAILFNVTKKEKVGRALSQAWKLFIKNWLVSIEMAILMFFIGLGVIVALALAVGVISIPLSLVILVFAQLGLSGLMYLVLIISLIILFLLILWIGAMWSSFRFTAWTILFVRISEGQVLAKLVRLVAGRKLENAD